MLRTITLAAVATALASPALACGYKKNNASAAIEAAPAPSVAYALPEAGTLQSVPAQGYESFAATAPQPAEGTVVTIEEAVPATAQLTE